MGGYDIIEILIASFISCTVGVFVSLIPLKRMIELNLEDSRKEASGRREFEVRRSQISDEAIHAAMKIIFWITRGLKTHSPADWNGELEKAVKGFEAVENKLVTLNNEIVDAFKAEHTK